MGPSISADGSQWSSFRGAVPPIQRTRSVAGHHVSLLCTVRRGLAAFLALCIKHFGQPLAPPVVGQPSEGVHVREPVIVSDSQIVSQLPAYIVDQRRKQIKCQSLEVEEGKEVKLRMHTS